MRADELICPQELLDCFSMFLTTTGLLHRVFLLSISLSWLRVKSSISDCSYYQDEKKGSSSIVEADLDG
jgi:hypothetical protein